MTPRGLRSVLGLAACGFLAVAAIAGGCSSGGGDGDGKSSGACDRGPRTEAPLLDMTGWIPGDAGLQADPYGAERPPTGDCPEGGSYLEGSSFEVNTAICTWAWFQQPTLTDLVPGDVVELVYWHSVLVSDPPAQGHLSLWVGDEVLYDTWIDIPKEASAYTDSVEVGFCAPSGAVATFHLNNHGANTWNVLRVDRQATP